MKTSTLLRCAAMLFVALATTAILVSCQDNHHRDDAQLDWQYEPYIESIWAKTYSETDSHVINNPDIFVGGKNGDGVYTVYYVGLPEGRPWHDLPADEMKAIALHCIARCYIQAEEDGVADFLVIGVVPLGYTAFTESTLYGYKEQMKTSY